MKAVITFLSQDEIQQIHEATLSVLERTGVIIDSEAARALLGKKGAKVTGNNVRFPKEMVEEAIGQINKTVLFAARDPVKDFTIPYRNTTFNATSGYSPFIYDEPGGERRRTTAKDLEEAARLCDALPEVDFFWPITMPTEEACGELEEISALDVSIRNITKHIECSCSSGAAAEWQVRIAQAAAGGADALRKRPLFSAVSSPTTPLSIESFICDALEVFAKAGVPVTPMNVPLGGTTAPCSFAGTLVVTNAEQLATLLILKAWDPDAPMVYSADTGSADLRTGNVAYNNPDYDLYSFACAQLARFYDIPCTVGSGSYEERSFGTLAGFNQNVLKTAINQMSMTDGACWIGSLDDCLATSWWDIVLDAEVLKYAKLYCKELSVDANSLALDVIHEVGPRGEFISHEHTLENFRHEITLTSVEDSYLFASGRDFIELAREKADGILNNHVPAPLDDALVKELDGYMEAARSGLAG
ncbi:MAG: trimethylamine methyltransferase family protein [Clostridiales bacterium]|nr:trimethylamine methyltransferase family protein [Clostridiales bacterium]